MSKPPFHLSLGELGTLQGEQPVGAQGHLGIGAGNSPEVLLSVGGCACALLQRLA